MPIIIRSRFTHESIYQTSKDSLQGVCLGKANLENANFYGQNLRGANLQYAYLYNADLREADLQEADLRGADLRGADLRGADLRRADLRGADLRGADLDFSSGLAFLCTSFSFIADQRLAAQLAYHFCCIVFHDCEEAQQAQEAIKALANKFHRVNECGLIK